MATRMGRTFGGLLRSGYFGGSRCGCARHLLAVACGGENLVQLVGGATRIALEIDVEDAEVSDWYREGGSHLACFDESVGVDVLFGWAPEVTRFHCCGRDAMAPYSSSTTSGEDHHLGFP